MDISANVGTNLGTPIKWTIAGKEREFGLMTQGAKAQIEQQLISRARAQIKKDKEFMTDDEYGIAYSVFHDRVVTGQYCFGSKLCTSWILTPIGVSALVGVLSGDSTVDWESVVFNEMREAGELIALVMSHSFPNLMKGKEENP